MINPVLRWVCVISLMCLCACSSTSNRSVNLKRAAELNAEMGTRYMAQGRLDIAKIKFEKAIKADPKLAVAHAGYGLLWSRLGESGKANKHFKKALKLEPKNPGFLNNYGTFLCGQGKVKQAEERFLAALEDPLYPTPEYAYTNAGRCALKIEDYNKAEAYFGKALTANPRFPDALEQMALIYESRGQYKQAYAALQKFEQSGTHTPESLELGIRLAQKLGDRNKVASYKLLLKNKFPDSEQAARLRSMER